MRVHTCTVSDGQGGEAVAVLDKKGFVSIKLIKLEEKKFLNKFYF